MSIGLGEPFFDSAESLISHIVFSIPAVKGIEFGSGFMAARMKGSEHNDRFVSLAGKTLTNNSGGINGGISNGNDIVFRVAVKPTSSIVIPQSTMNMQTGKMTELVIEGRHDLCIALRMPVILEAVTAIVLADLMMIEHLIPRIYKSDKKGK
jgi:chorismate synthase